MTATVLQPWRWLVGQEPFLLVGRLTLLVTLVNARELVPMLLVAVAGTVLLVPNPGLMRRAWPWIVMAVLFAAVQVPAWWQLENHVVATTYWVLALGLSRLGDEPERLRRNSARILVGLIFLLAAGWKLYSSQFITNEFFRYTLVWDERFESVALLAGTDEQELEQAQARLRDLTVSGDAEQVVELPEGRANTGVAFAFTAWGLATELTIALAFLLPLSDDNILRPASVYVFCATTYLLAPVVGFGLLLLTLTAAATTSPRVRAGSAVGCGVLFVWGALFPRLFV